MWGFAPSLRNLGHDLGFANLVIVACAALYLLTLAVDPGGIGMEGVFGMLSPSGEALFRFGAAGAIPTVWYGRWWTVLSAGWLHGSLLHILFNVLWLRQLAPAVAEIYGASRMVILYVVASAVGFGLSSGAGAWLVFLPRFLHGAQFTIGASAGIFGLLAALVAWGRRGGAAHVGQQAWSWAVFVFVMGFLPGMRVDNYAHLGGFLGGYAMSRLLDPHRPERGGHVVAALVCLVATVAAIVASMVVPLPMP